MTDKRRVEESVIWIATMWVQQMDASSVPVSSPASSLHASHRSGSRAG